MKFAEINKRYTEIVADYISKGYIINAGTMNGSQGEIAHIDFTDGNEVIRVFVEKIHEWRSGDYVQIVVGKVVQNIKINTTDSWNTIWNNKLEVIYCKKFYILGEDRNSGTEYGTKEEAEQAKAKRFERYDRSSGTVDLTEKYFELAKRIVKRKFNKKKVCNDDIKLFTHNGNYYVAYKCETIKLH